jgi:hypothetical protein
VRDPGEVLPQRVADLPQPLGRPLVDDAEHGLGLGPRRADDRDARDESALEPLCDACTGRGRDAPGAGSRARLPPRRTRAPRGRGSSARA